MSRYMLTTYNANKTSQRVCVINTDNIEYVVRIAQRMLHSREENDRIEVTLTGKPVFVLGRMNHRRADSKAGSAFPGLVVGASTPAIAA